MLLQLLVLAFGIVLIVGAVNPFGANSQHLSVDKPSGVTGVPVLTQPVRSGGSVSAEVVAQDEVQVLLVRMDIRDLDVPQDEVLRDNTVVAAGSGRSVHVSTPYPNSHETSFAVLVLPPEGSNATEASLDYKLTIEVYDPDLPMMALGILAVLQFGIVRMLVLLYERPAPAPSVEEPEQRSALPPTQPDRRPPGAYYPQPPMPAAPQAPPAADEWGPQSQGQPPSPPAPQRRPGGPSGLDARGPPPAGPPRRPAPERAPGGLPPAGAPPPEAGQPRGAPPIAGQTIPGREPLKRIKCGNCRSVLPIYIEQRPLRILCPNCGAKGMLR